MLKDKELEYQNQEDDGNVNREFDVTEDFMNNDEDRKVEKDK